MKIGSCQDHLEQHIYCGVFYYTPFLFDNLSQLIFIMRRSIERRKFLVVLTRQVSNYAALWWGLRWMPGTRSASSFLTNIIVPSWCSLYSNLLMVCCNLIYLFRRGATLTFLAQRSLWRAGWFHFWQTPTKFEHLPDQLLEFSVHFFQTKLWCAPLVCGWKPTCLALTDTFWKNHTGSLGINLNPRQLLLQVWRTLCPIPWHAG